MKKVLIATSSELPQLSSFFAKSLAETYAEGAKEEVEFEFFWSPDEFSFRNEAADIVINKGFDTLVLIKPHIQWVAPNLISIIKNTSLIEGVATKNFYSPAKNYKAVVNPINEENDVSARFMDLNFIKIEKEVFERIKDFVIHVNLVENELIQQIPMYFYATADESGPISQDINFCLAAEKAEIPVQINLDTAIWEHVWTPYRTFIGEDIRKDFVNKGFEEVEQL